MSETTKITLAIVAILITAIIAIRVSQHYEMKRIEKEFTEKYIEHLENREPIE